MTRYDQLMDMIAVDTEDCIVWPYAKSGRGYGAIKTGGKMHGAHRLALLSVAPPPTPKHQAAHGECHNVLCVNPNHLSWKTGKENNADKYRDGTDQNGEDHPRCKLTSNQVEEIRARYKGQGNGPTQRELADEYGIGSAQVCHIVNHQKRKLR